MAAMHWNVTSDSNPQNLADFESILLHNRGITVPSEFFNPLSPLELSLSSVGIDPNQVTIALKRLQYAHEQQEEILVFGDYDADGICAAAVMWLALHHAGYKAKPFIPHREKHGYGISHRAIDDILAGEPPKLIITVDNGIVAHEPIQRLRDAGIDVIVTDHHLPESQLPPALAIVHTTQLCGTTVAWMFAKALVPESVVDLLDFCGIATIADQVPLKNANRSFATAGIKALQKTQRVGLTELMAVANLDQARIDATAVNYGLAPRINAMGRLSHGLEALRLLCTSNVARARALMMTLQSTNVRRQDLTETMIAQAQLQADSWQDEHLIVVSSPDFHEGVIGLIAGKLMEQYHKPAIVIAVGKLSAKASARSVAGVNIVELIRQVRDDLTEVGGHPMAAGFGLLPDKIETVKHHLLKIAREQIRSQLLIPVVTLDCVIEAGLLSTELAAILEKFAPFGSGNTEPILGLKGMLVIDAQTMGKTNKHLRLLLSHPDLDKPLSAIFWNKADLAEQLKLGAPIEIASVIEINEWKGRKNLQLRLKDIKSIPLEAV